MSENASRIGGQLADTFLTGAGLGVGGMGLWHAIKGMQEKRKRERAARTDFHAVANTPPPLSAISPKQANLHPAFAVTGGAGLGALIGAINAGKGKRFDGALGGAALGSGIGLAGHTLLSEGGRQAIGKAMGATPDGSILSHESVMSRAGNNLALPLAGVGGAALGAGFVNSFAKEDKTDENLDRVQKSRNDYFRELLGEGTERTACDAAFEKFYAMYKTAANSWTELITNTLFNPGDSAQSVAAWVPTVMGASALTGGAFGAKHMYDKTRASSQAKLYAAAQKTRDRLRGLDTPWVDPVELATIKDLTSRGGMAHSSGR